MKWKAGSYSNICRYEPRADLKKRGSSFYYESIGSGNRDGRVRGGGQAGKGGQVKDFANSLIQGPKG